MKLSLISIHIHGHRLSNLTAFACIIFESDIFSQKPITGNNAGIRPECTHFFAVIYQFIRIIIKSDFYQIPVCSDQGY
ncbi:Uncharacterised protein [Mycobacteroides abscessus subsp. abscessus]|nr:Uncharacterised protein [Mycobacteroides abscessus subsp. abscessus]